MLALNSSPPPLSIWLVGLQEVGLTKITVKPKFFRGKTCGERGGWAHIVLPYYTEANIADSIGLLILVKCFEPLVKLYVPVPELHELVQPIQTDITYVKIPTDVWFV